jgi:cation diffusion facilitator family transporter
VETKDIQLKKKAALISLIIGFLMFFGKVGAYFLTGSAAILSDAMESVVHIFATSFAFYSLIVSTRPPDEGHPYGHGKIEFFSAGFEGALIIVAAIFIIGYSVRDIIIGRQLQDLDTGTYIITAASVINLILGMYLVRMGRKTNSLILVADGKHVLTDSITSFGAVAALILVLFTGIKLFDPVIAIILALNILWTGKDLVRESIGGLMHETDNKLIEQIAAGLQRQRADHPEWIDVHRFRYWRSGEKYHFDYHLIIPYFITAERSHKIQHTLELVLKDTLKTSQLEQFIHTEPCNPDFCKMCRTENCSYRTEKLIKEPVWDGKKITSYSAFVN